MKRILTTEEAATHLALKVLAHDVSAKEASKKRIRSHRRVLAHIDAQKAIKGAQITSPFTDN